MQRDKRGTGLEKQTGKVGGSILLNAVSQIGGRLFLSGARLGITVIVVRYAGTQRFGEYALALSFILVAEWLADFGFTEISVRNICRAPASRGSVMKALMLIKAFQGVAAFVVLLLLLFVFDYSSDIVIAGMAGGTGLFFYSASLVYRTQFRVNMQMERDVLGEIIGVLVMVPLIWFACYRGAPIYVLTGCYALSRMVFFVAALCFGRQQLAFKSVDGNEGLAIIRAALPLGILGLLVCLYDSLVPVLLSKLADMQSVAYFSCALRFVLPVIIVIQAIGTAVYPALSSCWRNSEERFIRIQQDALESSVLIACGFFCMMNASAGFLMRLIGPDMESAASVLRLLSWVLLARAVVTVMSPMIIIAGGQARALWLTVLSIVCKLLMLVWLIPAYGITGAIATYIATEFLISMLPVILVSQQMAGVSLHWRGVMKSLLSALTALGVCRLSGEYGDAAGGVLAFTLYAIFAVGSGALSTNQIKRITAGIKSRFMPAETGANA